MDRKCRIAVGKKRGSEAYRKGCLSLGKEGESGQEVWDICRKKGENLAGEWMSVLKRGRERKREVDRKL